jgi:hypothetical protein
MPIDRVAHPLLASLKLQMSHDLMPKKVKVDPLLRAATLRAS